MSVSLSPLARQQFSVNGVPVSGGLLFTYAAGTTNKLATYTDASGATPNTNPVVLDSQGQADVWMTAGTKYKLVLSPANDTDPPTNPYWTRDNIVSSVDYNALAASSGSSLVGFQQAGAGAVARTLQGKLLDFLSTEDFAGSPDQNKFTSAGAANNGGMIIVPNVAYALTALVTANGEYVSNSATLLPQQLSPADAFGKTSAKHLSVASVSGSNLNKIRIAKHQVFSSSGAGSTIALTGTGDFARGLNVTKTNYATTTTDGEIGGDYIFIRQGGGTASDCSAALYDVGTYSTSFSCITEGAAAHYDVNSNITDRIRVITGFQNKGAADMGGIALEVEYGAASNLIYNQVANGTTVQNYIKCVDLTTGLSQATLFTLDATGQQVTFMRNVLGGTTGNLITTRSMNAYDGAGSNRDEVREQLVRNATGTTYATAEWRIQRVVDNATIGSGISMWYDAVQGWGVSLVANGARLMTATSAGYMGFYSAAPIAKPTVTGSKGGNAALTSLLSALNNQGLLTDSST